ncbi:hypothetical protein AB0M46_28715 [Dactylosporangium sp. NPDC051485]|uniref:hypothetical protein n=1 Tax=Dactylosporangium sp. NPDC051485 TaxID=3154846 RepID=UPI00343A6408
MWAIFDRGPLSSLIRAGVDDDSNAQVRAEAQWLEWLPDTAGTPFSDGGPERTIRFHALDASWTVHGRNTQDTVLAIEELTATLQILLVEFASLEPMLIARPVDIEVRTYGRGQAPEQRYLTRMDGETRRWLLYLPADGDNLEQDDADGGTVGLLFRVLLGNSLLDLENFSKLMDQGAGNGLFRNIEIGRPYRELAMFRDQPHPPLADARFRPLTSSGSVQPSAASPHLRSRSGPGPGYTVEKAHAILAERYEQLPIPIAHTLPRLLGDERVRALFRHLRREGWKDWHLLNVVRDLTVSHRLSQQSGPFTMQTQDLSSRFLAEAQRLELPDDPHIDPSAVTGDAMTSGINRIAVSSMRRWGLTPQHADPTPGIVLSVLEHRYGFWTDDIAHPDPFSGVLDETS